MFNSQPELNNIKTFNETKVTTDTWIFFLHVSKILFLYYLYFAFSIYQSNNDGKDQESIQSSTTPDQGNHMGKWQSTIKHHKQEPRGHLSLSLSLSRWPQRSNEQTRKHDKHKT